jgi:hypothetical protein
MRYEKFRTSIKMRKVDGIIEMQQEYCINCYKYKQYPKTQVGSEELINFINSNEIEKSFTFEVEYGIELES